MSDVLVSNFKIWNDYSLQRRSHICTNALTVGTWSLTTYHLLSTKDKEMLKSDYLPWTVHIALLLVTGFMGIDDWIKICVFDKNNTHTYRYRYIIYKIHDPVCLSVIFQCGLWITFVLHEKAHEKWRKKKENKRGKNTHKTSQLLPTTSCQLYCSCSKQVMKNVCASWTWTSTHVLECISFTFLHLHKIVWNIEQEVFKNKIK